MTPEPQTRYASLGAAAVLDPEKMTVGQTVTLGDAIFKVNRIEDGKVFLDFVSAKKQWNPFYLFYLLIFGFLALYIIYRLGV